MPSRKSKKPVQKPNSPFPSSPGRVFSEVDLPEIAAGILRELESASGARLLFEGPLGAGKTTLVMALLERLGVDRPAEGSPSFPVAHEYRDLSGQRVIHADLYRLKSEAELEATGLLESLWDPSAKVLIEWGSLFPEVMDALRRDFRGLEVSLAPSSNSQLRELRVQRF